MSALYTIKVEGLGKLVRNADAAGKDAKRLVREGLRDAVEPVREEAERLFDDYNRKTAASYRVVIRRTGLVAVETRFRRTTGKRPDFGGLQKRKALYPARDNKRPEVLRRLERELEKAVRRFE